MKVGPLLTPFRAAGSLGRGFWAWWVAELSGLIPRSWRDRMRGRIEARIRGDDVEIEISRPPNYCVKGIYSSVTESCVPESLSVALRRERTRLPVWLLPPAQSILSRIVALPRSAVPAFAQLLSFEADRWTPYRAADIVAAWQEIAPGGSGKADIELRFVPRTSVEEWQRQLAEIGLAPSLILLGSTPVLRAPLTLRGTKLSRVRRMAAAALMLATTIYLLADWVATVREREVLRRLIEAEQQDYAQQRDLERRIEDILTASREQKRGGMAKSRGELLPALAGAIPETDWLTEIIFAKDTATLRGYAANPERLLKALSPLAGHGDVALQGELALDAKLERQRFSVALMLGEGE
jgi:general secretion pathway protein L